MSNKTKLLPLNNPDRKMIVQAVCAAMGLLRDGKTRSAVIVIHLSPDAPLNESTCDFIVNRVKDLNTAAGEKFHKAVHSLSANKHITLTLTLTRETLSAPIAC